MLDPGQKIGGFQIGALLGKGAMGEVYRGEQLSLKRPVAIKRIAAHLLDNDNMIARFEREARILARINHTNVVGIYEFGLLPDETGTKHYLLVMELVDGGKPLSAYMDKPMAWQDATCVVRMCAEGLAAAGEHGVVHRDIKPDNIMMTGKGIAKLVDFGLARAQDTTALTMQAVPMGTPLYMSPEACRGEEIGPASDLYSLGCSWFQMITGRHVFQAGNLHGLLFKHMTDLPPNPLELMPSVPEPMVKLLYQCLEKDPAKRPANAAALANAIDSLSAQGLIVPRHARDLIASRSTAAPATPAAPAQGGTTAATMISGPARNNATAATMIAGAAATAPVTPAQAPAPEQQATIATNLQSTAITAPSASPSPQETTKPTSRSEAKSLAPAKPGPPWPLIAVVAVLVVAVGIAGVAVALKPAPAVPATPAVVVAPKPDEPKLVDPFARKPVTTPPAEAKPVVPAIPVETKPAEPKPAEIAKPVEAAKPVDTSPAEAPAPVLVTKPVETSVPPKPADTKPAEASKPDAPTTDTAKPVEPVVTKPAEAPKPVEVAKPAETTVPPKPVEAKPAETPKPVDSKPAADPVATNWKAMDDQIAAKDWAAALKTWNDTPAPAEDKAAARERMKKAADADLRPILVEVAALVKQKKLDEAAIMLVKAKPCGEAADATSRITALAIAIKNAKAAQKNLEQP